MMLNLTYGINAVRTQIASATKLVSHGAELAAAIGEGPLEMAMVGAAPGSPARAAAAARIREALARPAEPLARSVVELRSASQALTGLAPHGGSPDATMGLQQAAEALATAGDTLATQVRGMRDGQWPQHGAFGLAMSDVEYATTILDSLEQMTPAAMDSATRGAAAAGRNA